MHGAPKQFDNIWTIKAKSVDISDILCIPKTEHLYRTYKVMK